MPSYRSLLGGKGIIVAPHRHSHMLLHVRLMHLGGIISSIETQWVLEDHPLGIALADALGFHTIAAYRLLLPALDATLATSWRGLMNGFISRCFSLDTYSDILFWFASSGLCALGSGLAVHPGHCQRDPWADLALVHSLPQASPSLG